MSWQEVLKRNPSVAVRLGWRLMAVAAELVAGRVDDAIARGLAGQEEHPEWRELDRATATLDGAARDQGLERELKSAALAFLSVVVGIAIRELLGRKSE